MGHSEKRKDLFGNEYTQHFDDEGRKAGWSETRKDFFGNEYEQHFDKDGGKTGYSENRKGIFGDYTQHHDRSGRRTGYSEERKGMFGDYTDHRDQSGRRTGYSAPRQGMFSSYVRHIGGRAFGGGRRSGAPSRDGWIGWIDTMTYENIGAWIVPMIYSALVMMIYGPGRAQPDTFIEIAIIALAIPGAVAMAVYLFGIVLVIAVVAILLSVLFG